MDVICYMGGTCGDIVAAILDPRDAELAGARVAHHPDRTALKKPHQFSSVIEKDQYLTSITWHSVPSHDLDYHLMRGHDYIGIKINTPTAAIWAAERFRNLHREHVWQEMQNRCGAGDITQYAHMMMGFGSWAASHTKRCLALEDIMSGRAVDRLMEDFGCDVSYQGAQLYLNWLARQDL